MEHSYEHSLKTYPFSFENATFSLQIQPSDISEMKMATEIETLRKHYPEWNFLSTPFSWFRVDGEK